MRKVKFSIMLFSGALENSAAAEYRRAIELAQIADREGFSGFWLPERHYSHFGAPYPKPLLLLAALAGKTKHLALRAGSVVAPLHDPLAMAEELSVLDNLSDGRVEVAFASGWHPNDFACSPDTYLDRRKITLSRACNVLQLWAGEDIERQNGLGDYVPISTFPRPRRVRLPVWLTAAGSTGTYEEAGRHGFDVLTHVLGGDVKALEGNIASYRRARADAGFDPQGGRVALMLHTFLAKEMAEAIQIASRPFVNYLKSIAPLGQGLVDARSYKLRLDELTPDQLDRFANLQFDRLSNGRALIGTPESVLGTIESMSNIGVSEIACLVDFGIEGKIVVDHFSQLIELKRIVDGTNENIGGQYAN